jgi:hypothetical protein
MNVYEAIIVHFFFVIAGMWIWGTPVEMEVDGSKVSVLYLDTEGFESVGKSNVYDDRFVPKNTPSGFIFPRIDNSLLLLEPFLLCSW